jgi:hypothetical protein
MQTTQVVWREWPDGRQESCLVTAPEYLKWVAEGNTALPADPEPVPAPDTEALRKAAYREESDPLFFKWQRGEANEAEWIAAVIAIKARYPEPT